MAEKAFYRWEVNSFTVRLALDVVESLSQQFQNPRLKPGEEHGGLLFGRFLDINSIEITGFEFVRSRHRRGIPYDLGRLERDNFERRVRALIQRRQGPRPVGYFRTHLRPGLFLDQSDFALMTEAFSGGRGIALAIRMTEPSDPNAGIFFWEGGDIDRTQPKLTFPFDAARLREQGPIDIEAPAPPIDIEAPAKPINTEAPAAPISAQPAPAPPSARVFKARPAWAVGLAAGLASGILAFATLSAFHHGGQNRPAVSLDPAAPPRTQFASSDISPFSTESRDVLTAPPAAFEEAPSPNDEPDEAAGTGPAPRAREVEPERKPAPAPPPVEPAQPTVVARNEPPALPAPQLPVSIPSSTPLPSSAPLVAAESASTALPAPPRRESRPVIVDVAVEPRGTSTLKRVTSLAGHVPLLGRIHGLRNGELVSPRPERDLTPQIPARVSRDLDGEVRVDVEASIDDSGVVQDAEIRRGAESEFGLLAADKVRSVRWQPARSGDHSVPMDVIVHYRFNPAREQ